MADGEGFEPPVELPPQRFSRPPHSTALPTIRNYLPSVFQPTVLVLHMILSCLHSTSLTLVVKTRTPQHTLPTIRNYLPSVFLPMTTAHIVHYFLRNANTKINIPAKSITNDNNCPMVRPHDVRNPIWASGARNNSQNIRNTAYNIPINPPNAPGC